MADHPDPYRRPGATVSMAAAAAVPNADRPEDGGRDSGAPSPRGGGPERRRRPTPRRRSREGLGRRSDDQPTGRNARQVAQAERRRSRTIREQRKQWAEVRRWVRQAELEPFRQLLERLAQVAFGPAATVMPHLRRSRGRQYLIFVVDAACPEAGTNYEGFLPLERAFWTAYAAIPKPTAPFIVAVRPARNWCRAEALMPLFTQFATPETVA